MIPLIGILQGRLTESKGRGIQFFPSENWRNEFKDAQKIGFGCMELLVKKDSLDANPLSENIDKLRQLEQKSGIKIFSTHLFYEKTDDYIQNLGRLIMASALVGAKTILIPFFNQNALASEEEKNIARTQLNTVRSVCIQANIRLGIETEMPAEELLNFILSFNNPCIGAYYDIGNMASMGVNLAKEIQLLGHYICGVHIKDRLPNRGETVPLGEGCADFKSAFTALKQIKYKGPLIIHGARNPEIDDVSLNKQYLRFVKKILKEVWSE